MYPIIVVWFVLILAMAGVAFGSFWLARRLSKRAHVLMEFVSVAAMIVLPGLFTLTIVYTP